MKHRKPLRVLLSLVLVVSLLAAWGPAAFADGSADVVTASDSAGDIALTAPGVSISIPCDEAVAQGLSDVVDADASNGHSVTVRVEGDIFLIITPGGDSTAYANGARAFASGPSSDAAIDVAGDLNAANSSGGSLGASAVSTVEGKAEIYIHGDVSVSSATSSATGVEAYVKGGEQAGTASTVTVDGSVSVSGASHDSTALDAEVNNGHAAISVGGNAEAVSEDSAIGASIRVFGSSNADLDVDGSLSAEGAFLVNGLIVYASGDVQVTAKAGAVSANNTDGPGSPSSAIGVITQAFGGAEVTVAIGSGGVSATGPANCETHGLELVNGGGSISFATDGDVHGDSVGLLTAAYSESNVAMDVLIEGTLSGGEQALRIERGSAEGLNLTVWKASVSENGTVAAAGEAADAGAAEAAEAGILYIIKLEQPGEGGSVTLDGVTASHGFDVAREGDTVTLKTTLDEGYVVKAAYNDGEALTLKDADGNFYMLVPKGGGVLLSVELGAPDAETPPPSDDPTAGEDTPAPAYQNVTAPGAGVYVLAEPADEGPQLVDSVIFAGIGQTAQLDFYDDGSCVISFPDGSSFEGRFEIVDGALLFNGIEITVTVGEDGQLHCVFVRNDGVEVEFVLSPEFIEQLAAALAAE